MRQFLRIFSALGLCLWLGSCMLPPGGEQRPFDFARAKPDLNLTRLAVQPSWDSRVIACKAQPGTAKFASGWQDFETAAFDIARGKATQVVFWRKRKHNSSEQLLLQARYEDDGQKLVFCPIRDVAPGKKIACASLYTLEDDFKATGIKRTFDVPDAVRGGELMCAYKK